ncbi:hypothetical protein EN766_27990, partial [Mesorhizobium sp. M2A.F.Ca.ET.046.02.1.1]
MDIRAARSRLVHETRARLGDLITIRAKVRGEMSVANDPSRPAMVGVKGRFDINPDLEFLGGHDRGMAPIRFAGRLVTSQWSPAFGSQAMSSRGIEIVHSRPTEPIYA